MVQIVKVFRWNQHGSCHSHILLARNICLIGNCFKQFYIKLFKACILLPNYQIDLFNCKGDEALVIDKIGAPVVHTGC